MLNIFLKWLTYRKFWAWIMVNIFAKLTFRWDGYPLFPMERYFDIVRAIDEDEKKNGPGVYVFVCCDQKSLSCKLIRFFSNAFWTHAGLFIGTERVLHMKAQGALYWHALEEMKQSDFFAVGRVDVSEMGYTAVHEEAAKILANLSGYSYDFAMELDNDGKRMYCSELIYKLCEKYAVSPNFKSKLEYGRLVFEPDDLYKSMKVIFEYKG